MSYAWHYLLLLWTELWKYGMTAVVIAGLVALYLFAPAWFPGRFRKACLWLAAVLAYGMAGYIVGVWDEHGRMQALRALDEQRGYERGVAARAGAEAEIPPVDPAAGPNDRELRDTANDRNNRN